MLYKYKPNKCSCQVPNHQELKQAWGKWLSGLADWDWFLTLTFREPSEEEIARGYTQRGWRYAKAAYNRFLGALPAPLGVEHWVRMFEFSRWRGVPHIHALISGCADLRRDEAWSWWFTRYGINRILPYDPTLGAGFYLCKYVVKELGDIEFSKSLTKRQNCVKT